MITSIGILMFVAIIIWIEVPTLLRRKQRRELLVFFSILSVSAITLILNTQGVPVPNPLKGIEFVFEPIGRMIFR